MIFIQAGQVAGNAQLLGDCQQQRPRLQVRIRNVGSAALSADNSGVRRRHSSVFPVPTSR